MRVVVSYITLPNKIILAKNCLQAKRQKDKIGYKQLTKKTDETEDIFKKRTQTAKCIDNIHLELGTFPCL